MTDLDELSQRVNSLNVQDENSNRDENNHSEESATKTPPENVSKSDHTTLDEPQSASSEVSNISVETSPEKTGAGEIDAQVEVQKDETEPPAPRLVARKSPFAKQSLIDVPDYGYISIDGGYQAGF